MTKVYCVMFVLLLVGATSCTNKEQLYQGMYQGFSSVSETRRTEDPSYDPVRAREQNPQSYQEYKRARELLLKEDGVLVNGENI